MRLRPRNPVAPVTKTRIDSCLHGEVEGDSGFDQVAVVPENLVLEVPGQDVIRVGRVDLVFQHNRYVHAGRNKPAPQRVLLNQTFHEIRADAVVIEERVSFHRSAETEYAFAKTPLLRKEFKALLSFSDDVARKAAIRFKVVCPRSYFCREHEIEPQ